MWKKKNMIEVWTQSSDNDKTKKNGVLISNRGQLGAIAIILRNGLLASLPLLRLIKERCTGTILVTFPIWRRCEKKQIIFVGATSRYICQKKIYEHFVKTIAPLVTAFEIFDQGKADQTKDKR